MGNLFSTTTRTIAPRDMVVQIDQIVELLRTKLTPGEIDSLLNTLLSGTQTQVQPGDIISAELMNYVLAQIGALAKRVAFLEGTLGKDGDVVISSLFPEDGNLKVGEQLKILGKNFEYSKGLARVYVDRYPVLGFLPGSSDEQLICTIPQEIIDVPDAGRPAILTVQNNSSRAQSILFLRPVVTLAGFFELNELDTRPSGAKPLDGKPFTMEYEVVSQANLDTTIQLSGVVTGPTNAADWQKNVAILNTDETVNKDGKLPIAQRERKRFLVRIDPIPSGTASGITFSLEAQVTASNGHWNKAVGFTVGTSYFAPDKTITLNFASGEIKPLPTSGSVDATGIKLVTGAAVKLVFSATFDQAGKYDLTISLPTGWKSQFTDGTVSPVDVAENEVTVGAKAFKNLHFTVWPDVNPASVGTLDVKLQRQGESTVRAASMNLKLI